MKQHALPMTTLFLAATLLLGCNETELTPTAPLDYAIVDGDTIKTRNDKALIASQKNKEKLFGRGHTVVGDTVVLYKAPKLHTPPAKAPDLSKLKNNDDPDLKGKPLRMIAIGGSLTAGVRDGGYFNEGIETSYPNLIARQMKLQKFEQPKFDAQDYNGVGRKVRTNQNYTGGPVPKFKAAENNGGIEVLDDKTIKLKKFKNNIHNLDNFSIPYFSMKLLSERLKNIGPQNVDDKPMIPAFYYNYVNDKSESIAHNFFSNKYDFFIVETGFNDLLGGYYYYSEPITSKPEHLTKSLSELGITSLDSYAPWLNDLSVTYRYIAESYRRNVKKGVIINTPDILKFPFRNIVTVKQVNDILRMVNVRTLDENGRVYPTSTIDSLVAPNVALKLKPYINNNLEPYQIGYANESDVQSYYKILKNLNDEKLALSKNFGYPLVDLYSFYEKLLTGVVITNDGVRVDPSYPNGNFFSSDGIYPTAFGQAVIANEVIKTMNSFYKTEIPLIPTREYLEK